MGKAHALLETLSESADTPPRSTQVINPVVDAARAVHLARRRRARCWAARGRVTTGSRRPPTRLVSAGARPAPCNALTEAERDRVLAVLTSDRFVDKSVAQTWATLLDEGTYLCSMSTMYRILRANHAAGERRCQATHPARTVPELVATGPGQVWSWDITKLRGPKRGVYFDLYVMIDIFSRYVVGWTVAAREDSVLGHRAARAGDRACTASPRWSTPTGAPR